VSAVAVGTSLVDCDRSLLHVCHDGMVLLTDDPRSEEALVKSSAAVRVGALDGDVVEPWHARGR
jgi:hypothetical protein